MRLIRLAVRADRTFRSRRLRGGLPVAVRAAVMLGLGVIMAVVAGCAAAGSGSSAGPPGTPEASPAALPVTSSGPELTGLGATVARWRAVHRLDRSVPARNAYLPHLGDEDTWQLVTTAGGRVISYTLNVSPSSLSKAVARARREMPAGTRVLWTRTVPGACSQVELKSAVLAAALGHGQVNVEFDNASTGRARPITEELFSVLKAPTVAKAPAC